jgi:hypothetical protein
MAGARESFFATALLLTIGEAECGAAEAVDKSQYTIFDPTPERLMRELTTDRPDTTETPFTVDAGHVQIEQNFLGYARSRPDVEGAVTDGFDVVTSNFRIGLTNAAEFDILVRPFGTLTTHAFDGAGLRQSGPGGLDLRVKYNLWGNDAFEAQGATAFALLPYVTIPIDRTNGVSPEYVGSGMVAEFAVKFDDAFSLGLNANAFYTKASDHPGYYGVFLLSASLGQAWTEKLGTYYEVIASFDRTDPRGEAVLVGGGLTYKATPNIQVDGGVNFGVTPAAARINPFVGLTTRF